MMIEVKTLDVRYGEDAVSIPYYELVGRSSISHIFLSAKDMYAGEVIVPEQQFLLTKCYGIKRREAAKIIMSVKLGDFVHYDDVLGYSYNPVTLEQHTIHLPK